MNFESRKYVLIAGAVFIAVVFILRLFWIQVVDDRWKAEAANMAERKVTVYPSRGLIFDRNEKLLVANTPVYDLMVVPREVKPFDTVTFAELISVPLADLNARFVAAAACSDKQRHGLYTRGTRRTWTERALARQDQYHRLG